MAQQHRIAVLTAAQVRHTSAGRHQLAHECGLVARYMALGWGYWEAVGLVITGRPVAP